MCTLIIYMINTIPIVQHISWTLVRRFYVISRPMHMLHKESYAHCMERGFYLRSSESCENQLRSV